LFWNRKDKNSQSLQDFYQDKKYSQDYDWIDYYRPKRKKASFGWGQPPERSSSGRRNLFRVAAVLSILALLFLVRQTDHPAGENMRSGLRYVLTTDWDVRPAMEKAVKFGLQMAGVDSQLDSGMPQDGTMKEAASAAGSPGPMTIPVSGRVVREYGWNKDSLDDMERFHPGIDIAVKAGEPVKAALTGKVKKVGSDQKYGRYVVLDHGEGVYTLYAGMENVKVAEGQTVRAGETVGDTARAGDVSGGGLHFELREKGVLTDPLDRIDFPPVK